MSSDTIRELPRQLAERATKRLSLLATTVAATSLVAAALSLLRQPNVGGIRDGTTRPYPIIALMLALSVALFFSLRSRRLSNHQKLDAGLGYLVIACLMGALYQHWLPYAPTDVARGVSATAVAILFFAILVPVPPKRMAIAAILAALMDPLALGITAIFGNPVPRPTFWLWLLAPGFVTVIAAIVASRILHDLATELRRAQQLGSYALIKRLGAGGMGEVWLAEHRMLARPAALKLIKTSPHDDEQAAEGAEGARFEREARATAMLTSPHTVALYDFGRSAEGTPYYAMELLAGMDLSQLVKKHGPLPAPRAMFIIAQICRSLEEAHRRGMVHRDIKPANIMVCRRGVEHDFVKVLDFGLVTLNRSQSVEAGGEELAVVGTPGYMAPEVARQKQSDHRADIYALGCTAYWLLTGRPVFDKAEIYQLLAAHLLDSPRAPSEVLGAPIDPELESIVLSCLAKEADARPASCAAIEMSLRPLMAQTPWTSEDAAVWWREHDADVVAEELEGGFQTPGASDEVDASTARAGTVVTKVLGTPLKTTIHD